MKVLIPMLGLARNGGNRVLTAIANRLAANGHDCEILTPDRGRPGFDLHPAVSITRAGPGRGPKWLRWLMFMLVCCARLRHRNVLANHFLTAVPARLAAMTSGARVIYLVQDMEFRFYRPPLSLLAWLLCRFTYGLPEIVPANPYLERALRAHGVAVQPALRLGVDPAFLSTPATGAARDMDVVCFPRGGRHKRLDRLVEILGRLRQRRLRILGIVPDAALRQRLAGLLDAVVVPHADTAIIAALDRARVMLLTSDHEGFALPPLEAMARGLPVVLFPCGGPEVYARDGHNALLVADRRPATAVELIADLLADPQRHADLAASARDTAADFRLDDAAAELVQRMSHRFQ